MFEFTTISASLGPTARSGVGGCNPVFCKPSQLMVGAAAIGGPDGAPGARAPGVSTASGKMKLDCEYLAISAFCARYCSTGTAGKNGIAADDVPAGAFTAGAFGS